MGVVTEKHLDSITRYPRRIYVEAAHAACVHSQLWTGQGCWPHPDSVVPCNLLGALQVITFTNWLPAMDGSGPPPVQVGGWAIQR